MALPNGLHHSVQFWHATRIYSGIYLLLQFVYKSGSLCCTHGESPTLQAAVLTLSRCKKHLWERGRFAAAREACWCDSDRYMVSVPVHGSVVDSLAVAGLPRSGSSQLSALHRSCISCQQYSRCSNRLTYCQVHRLLQRVMTHCWLLSVSRATHSDPSEAHSGELRVDVWTL
jgi:hypothetical protein